VGIAVRMMDNTIDVSRFPLEAQRQEAFAKRRIGLGMTGLADALIMTGLRYGSPEAAAQAGADHSRRDPQCAPDLDRSDRHDLPVCRQCLQRHRAGICAELHNAASRIMPRAGSSD